MDNMFQLQQNMTPEQIQQFGKERMKSQSELEQYYTSRQQDMALDAEALLNKYGQGVLQDTEMTQKVQDMPAMIEGEKESKRKSRMKKQLTKQAKQVSKMPEQKLLSDQQFFDQSFKPSMLTPKYVLENYASIALQLENWKKKLDSYEQNPELVSQLSSERQFRLAYMQQRYMEADMAFKSAVQALGFAFKQDEKGGMQIAGELTEEEKQQALLINQQLREKMEKQDAEIEEKVLDKILEEGLASVQPIVEEIRQDKAQDPEFAFIESQVLSNVYQYDEIKNLKDLIEQYPEAYQQHKEQVDVLYEEFYHLMEANAQIYLPSYALTNVQFDIKIVSSTALHKSIAKRIDQIDRQMWLIRNRASSIMNGVKHLLKGSKLTQADHLTLRNYVVLDTEQAQENRENLAFASYYADRYREQAAILDALVSANYSEHKQKLTTGNNGRFMMLMKPGQQAHNERVVRILAQLNGITATPNEVIDQKQVHRELKEVLKPYIDQIMAYEQKHFNLEEEADWRDQYEELQAISLFGMQITDMCKLSDPDAPEGKTLKDTLIGENQSLFRMKCDMIQGYAFQTRAYAIMKAFEQGTLTKESVTDREKQKIAAFFHIANFQEITPQHILYYAKKQIATGEAEVKSAYSRYCKERDSSSRNEFEAGFTPFEEYQHKGFHTVMMSVSKYAEEDYNRRRRERYIAENDIQDESQIPTYTINERDYVGMLRQDLNDARASLEHASPEQQQQIQANIAHLEQVIKYTKIRYALSRRGYRTAMDDDYAIGEPMFRTFGGIESVDTFREMSEEDFEEMCRLLAAGTLEEDLHVPERRAAYYEENRRGLEIYKAHMKAHYERYYELLQGKVPTMDFIINHEKELADMGANMQVDINLMSNVKEMIDLDNPEDVRLYHLVQGLNAITGYIYTMGFRLQSDKKASYDIVDSDARAAMTDSRLSIEFINTQGGMTQEQIGERVAQANELTKQADTQLKEQIAAYVVQRNEIEESIGQLQATYQRLSKNADEKFAICGEILKNGFSVADSAAVSKACNTLISRKHTLTKYYRSYHGAEVDEIGAERFYFTEQLLQLLEKQVDIYVQMRKAHSKCTDQKKKQRRVLAEGGGMLLYDAVKHLPEQAGHIEQATVEEKLQYIGHVIQIKKHIETYGEESVFTNRLKAIYKEAVAPLKNLGTGMEHTMQSLYENPEMMESPKQYREALSSEDPAVML